jgi:hypothetical protein
MISVKRPSVFEDFNDHVKRYRLEDVLEASSASAEEIAAAAAVVSSFDASERRSRESSVERSQEPAHKRLRLGESPLGTKEAGLRSWAEDVVQALQGCPSVDEAVQRCARILSDMETEVRQACLREAECETTSRGSHGDSDERPPQEGQQSLQHTNRVLMRAVQNLAEKCRRLEAGNEEITLLRQELEKSEEIQRRLQHSNELLQHHLRIHLDHCGERPTGMVH